MRAILINPYNQTVTEQDIGADIKDWHALLRANDPQFSSDLVDRVVLGDNIDLWVDDEGVLSDGRPVFQFVKGPSISGVAFLCSHNDEGDSIGLDAKLTLKMVQDSVQWTEWLTTGETEPDTSGEIDHPVFGKTFQVVGGDPIYRQAAGYVVRCEDASVTTAIHPFAKRSDALAYVASLPPDCKPQIYEIED